MPAEVIRTPCSSNHDEALETAQRRKLDFAQEPWRVLQRASVPFLGSEMPYETDGFFPNVVFSNGLARTRRVSDVMQGLFPRR